MSSMESITMVMDEPERKENIMSNPSKKKGTAAESKVVNYLREQGFDAERIALHGSSDQGDVVVRMPYANNMEDDFILEIKSGKQTENYSRNQRCIWWQQAWKESQNYCLDNKLEKGNESIDTVQPRLVIVRYNRALTDAEVWLPYDWDDESEGNWTLWYLDDFAKELKRWQNTATELKAKKEDE